MARSTTEIVYHGSSDFPLEVHLGYRQRIAYIFRTNGESLDVTDICSLDELNRDSSFAALIAAGTFTVSVTAGDSDLSAVAGVPQTVAELNSPNDNLNLKATAAGKVVKLNSITKAFTTNSNIGFQAKPGQSVSMANNVIGGEISPRLNTAVALTGSGSIIGLHVDAYLKGTSGNVAGDVRGMQIELVDDGSAGRTISGNAIGLRFRSNLSCTAITGRHSVISVENGEGSQKWDYLAEIEAETGVFDKTTAVNATQNGYLAVYVDGATRYLPLYTGHA